MILFFISAGDAGADDLFVSARSREEAVSVWRAWVTEFVRADARADAEPKQVMIVPKLRRYPGYHGWHARLEDPEHGVLNAAPEWDALETIAHAINHGITSYSQGNTKVIVE